MKHTLISFIAILLSVICIMSLVACGGMDDKMTSPATEKAPKETVTEPETEPETDPLEPENNRKESSVCFIGEAEEDSDAIFYDSLQEAVDANPNGADLKLCTDLSLDPFPVMPEGSDYTITFNWCDVTWENRCGVVYEYSQSKYVDFTYYSNIDKLFADHGSNLDQSYIWIFTQTGEYAPAKYIVSVIDGDDGPEFKLDYDCGVENWGREYIVECYGRFYYDLQDALDKAPQKTLIRLDIQADFIREEPIVVPLNNCCYRIVGNWYKMDCTFDRGATVDTDYGTETEWLCYYSDIDTLTKLTFAYRTHWLWIWTDMDGYKPGKYNMLPPSGLPDGEPDEDGLISYFTLNRFTLEWVAGIDTFRKDLYESEYDDYYPDGE